jgi:hypothetical protein
MAQLLKFNLSLTLTHSNMATIESADVVDALANQDSVSPDTKDIHRPSVPIPESFTGIYRNAIDYLSYGWRHKLLAEQRDHEPQCPPQLVYWSQLTAISALTGFTIGSLIRGRQTGLRFTAENWHRKPSTKRGWYLYHRNKNYNIAWGAFKGGFGHAVKFGGFLGAFFAGDICLDILRRRTDWWHGLAAGTVAGILFSIGSKC